MANARQRRQYWRLVAQYITANDPVPLTLTMRGFRIYEDAEEHAVKVMRKKKEP